MSKGSVYLNIPIILRVITIWDEVLLELVVSSYGLVVKKKIFLGYTHSIEKHIYVVVEALEVHISVSFEICLDEYFIKYF